MIDFLISEGPYYIYYCYKNISVSKIGDVVSFDKNLDYPISKEPWNDLFVSNEIESIGGTFLNKEVDILRIKINKLLHSDFYIVKKLFKENNFYLSIFQGDSRKKILCSLQGRFCGSKMTLSEIIFDFEVRKSEMMYN